MLWLRYQSASKRRKTAILDEFCATSGLSRKYAIRLMHRVPTHFTKRPGRLLKHIIPIKPFERTIDRPGHLEADTVAHCGNTHLGNFVWTVTATDIYSGWTECRAIWNKGSEGVLEALKDIEASLPFPILSFHSDNGSEFLNYTILRYFSPDGEKKRSNMLMTRSREYRKNDNCHVEQKNWSRVRELFAYDRIGNADLIAVMNKINKDIDGPLENFFIPQMKLLSKKRIETRYQRRYDKPTTPYRRLLACPFVDEVTKAALTERFNTLNPFRLSRDLTKGLNQFFKQMQKPTEEKVAA